MILIGGTDATLRGLLHESLDCCGTEIFEAPDREDFLRTVRRRKPSVTILVSSRRDGWDGLQVAEELRKWDVTIPVILVTRDSTEECAIAALRAGVRDYFKYPFSSLELRESVSRNIERVLQQSANSSFRPTVFRPGGDQSFICESRAMKEVRAYAMKVATTDCTTLITGETGTGKERVARFIHQSSKRGNKPLISINCAALPDSLLEGELFGHEKGAFTGASSSSPGKLRSADGGTVFMDEIGEMSPNAQTKILRAVESKEVCPLGARKSVPVNVRLIAATNQNLENQVEKGMFRKDLYYRLNVARIHIPPLRHRKYDIPLLLNHFIRELNSRFELKVEGFADEVFEFLFHYNWPGNIRELKNLLEATFINRPSGKISFDNLPDFFLQRMRHTDGSPQNERDQLLAALFSTNWNRSKAAEKLQWSRMTLYRKMHKYKIQEGHRHETPSLTTKL